MMEPIVESLLQYGSVGAFALLSIYALVKKDKQNVLLMEKIIQDNKETNAKMEDKNSKMQDSMIETLKDISVSVKSTHEIALETHRTVHAGLK